MKGAFPPQHPTLYAKVSNCFKNGVKRKSRTLSHLVGRLNVSTDTFTKTPNCPKQGNKNPGPFFNAP